MEDNKRIMGVLPGKIDIRDYKIKKNVAMAIQFPETFECPDTVKVKNQGSVGSCVAHATSQILEYHGGGTKNECPKLSTNFIYGIHYSLYGSKGPGMYLREACKIALNYGDPREDLCPGNTEVERVYHIAEVAAKSNDVINNAAKHKIKGYAKVSSEEDIKYAIMNHGPVLGAITWYNENDVDSLGILRPGTTNCGGHAIMLRGWNQYGWICQNSWGATWGKKGMFTLPYYYKLTEAYSLVPADNESDLDKPASCKLCDFICKILNAIVNIFNR